MCQIRFFKIMTQEKLEQLRKKAADLPPSPGVYLMKNAAGEILYVGKSRHLCNRVSSYFTGSRQTAKTARLVSLIADFDTIVCPTEMEALSLENTLIKRHAPKYNIRLKDAKSYPYIKMTNEQYPRLVVTRHPTKDGTYFGPYPGAADARANAETVAKLFGLIQCHHKFPEDAGRVRPCLYRQTHRCSAPCAGDVTAEEYRRLCKSAQEVLRGGVRRVAEELKAEMLRLAEEEQFEAAARIRDRIRALSGLGERQAVVGVAGEDTDVWAMTVTETGSALAVLTVRDGALIYKNEFVFPRTEILTEEGAVTFLADYYDQKGNCPPTVSLDFIPENGDVSLLEDYLTLTEGHRVHVVLPKRGVKSRLCRMAKENAEEAIEKNRTATMRQDTALYRLASMLGLETVPDRVEAYDVSNLSTECTTASMVVWENGALAKSRYRFFRIKDVAQDDYGAMSEAISRRFSHEGNNGFAALPDLILLDGGKGHVNTIKRLLAEMGVDVPVFGMVKDDFHKTRAITNGDGEIGIAKEQDVYTFVYNLHEEAHRFAVSRMMNAKRKTLKRSKLEDIPGIGKTRAGLLLKQFGSLKRVKEASREELERAEGMTSSAVSAVWSYFHSEDNK